MRRKATDKQINWIKNKIHWELPGFKNKLKDKIKGDDFPIQKTVSGTTVSTTRKNEIIDKQWDKWTYEDIQQANWLIESKDEDGLSLLFDKFI